MAFQYKHGALIAALPLVATAGTAQAGSLITNGDFSSPGTGTGWTNTQTVTGWSDQKEESGDVEVGNSAVYGLACENAGCQNAEVNSNTFGDVVQVVSGLTMGQKYTLSYLYGDRNGGGAQEQDVYFGNQLLGTNSSSGLDSLWAAETYTFVAMATSGNLEFIANKEGGLASYGNEITNVSLIAAIPEPASWAMMLAGFGIMGLAMRRRAALVRVTYT